MADPKKPTTVSTEQFSNEYARTNRSYASSVTGEAITYEKAQEEEAAKTDGRYTVQDQEAINSIVEKANVPESTARRAYTLDTSVPDVKEAAAMEIAAKIMDMGAVDTIAASLKRGLLPTDTSTRNKVRAQEAREAVTSYLKDAGFDDVDKGDIDKIMKNAAAITTERKGRGPA